MSNPRTLRASAALPAAGAYDPTPTTLDVRALNRIELCTTYTRGGAAGAFKLKVSVSDDGGTTFYQRTVIDGGSLASGALNVFGAEFKFPAPADGNPVLLSFVLEVDSATHVRVAAAEYGNTGSPGTLKITAVER